MRSRAKYRREISAKWASEGRCGNCGAPAAKNRKMCDRCLVNARNATRRRRAKDPDAFKRNYHARVEAGLCAGCGVPDKPVTRGRVCDMCSLTERQRMVRIKFDVMQKYGGKCACPSCGESGLAFLTIDHINNDGAQMRKSGAHSGGGHFYKRLLRLPVDPTLQILCYNCNLGKKVSGVCPHLNNSFVEAALLRGKYDRTSVSQ